MRKVAILTLFYRNYNYGGLLQGYALQKAIDSMDDVQADILKYRDGDNPIYSNVRQQAKQYGLKAFIKKFFEKCLEKMTFLIRGKIACRLKLFDDFIDECAGKNNTEYTDENISEALGEYDCFISGSDQVWNPNCIRNGFLQTFVPEEKIKISYAASIGRGRLTTNEQEIISKYVKKFDYISVREESAKKILQKNMHKDIFVALDPVFLLNKEDWDFGADYETEMPNQYVLVYSFSNSKAYRKKVEKYCKNNGLKLLYIPYAKQKFNLHDNAGKGEKAYNVGPKEFVTLIKHANMVLTDSFHGVALSIILNRNFYVFERDREKNATSMNARLYDLLNKFDLSNRIIHSEDFSLEQTDIDYNDINKKIGHYRNESFEFLKKAVLHKEK